MNLKTSLIGVGFEHTDHTKSLKNIATHNNHHTPHTSHIKPHNNNIHKQVLNKDNQHISENLQELVDHAKIERLTQEILQATHGMTQIRVTFLYKHLSNVEVRNLNYLIERILDEFTIKQEAIKLINDDTQSWCFIIRHASKTSIFRLLLWQPDIASILLLNGTIFKSHPDIMVKILAGCKEVATYYTNASQPDKAKIWHSIVNTFLDNRAKKVKSLGLENKTEAQLQTELQKARETKNVDKVIEIEKQLEYKQMLDNFFIQFAHFDPLLLAEMLLENGNQNLSLLLSQLSNTTLSLVLNSIGQKNYIALFHILDKIHKEKEMLWLISLQLLQQEYLLRYKQYFEESAKAHSKFQVIGDGEAYQIANKKSISEIQKILDEGKDYSGNKYSAEDKRRITYQVKALGKSKDIFTENNNHGISNAQLDHKIAGANAQNAAEVKSIIQQGGINNIKMQQASGKLQEIEMQKNQQDQHQALQQEQQKNQQNKPQEMQKKEEEVKKHEEVKKQITQQKVLDIIDQVQKMYYDKTGGYLDTKEIENVLGSHGLNRNNLTLADASKALDSHINSTIQNRIETGHSVVQNFNPPTNLSTQSQVTQTDWTNLVAEKTSPENTQLAANV